MTEDRRKLLGAAGEKLAAEHLSRLGMEIVDRNFRTRRGEIDIIAADGQFLIFCEVKTRVATRPVRDPLESVHMRKRNQVRMMAACWLVERGNRPYAEDLRFDAIGITLDPSGRLLRLDHLENAF